MFIFVLIGYITKDNKNSIMYMILKINTWYNISFIYKVEINYLSNLLWLLIKLIWLILSYLYWLTKS